MEIIKIIRFAETSRFPFERMNRVNEIDVESWIVVAQQILLLVSDAFILLYLFFRLFFFNFLLLVRKIFHEKFEF